MAENNIPDVSDLAKTALGAWVQRELAEQSWWQQKSNTIVTAVGGIVSFLWWIIGTGIELPQWALWTIGGIFFVATILGVNVTRNGLTPTLGAKIQKAATDPVVLNTIIRSAEQTAGRVISISDFTAGKHNRGD